MIPVHLTLQGFLSYRSRVELDFRGFDLACISGHNGAGKSTLLDAITWALFGVARKRDESIINSQSNAAEVALAFVYEGNLYRVRRALPRGKTTVLEFQIAQAETRDQASGGGSQLSNLEARSWKPLTGSSLRETQARIEETLRLDYDTFVNASFFLQGKADQFTQQRPGDRKRILGSILGLEVWETYRAAALERRKEKEGEIAALDGRLGEINSELAEEASRKARLKDLEEELERLGQTRQAQEAALESIRKVAATLAEQRRLVETLARQAQAGRRRVDELAARLVERKKEQDSHQATIARAAEINAAYKGWQQARADVEYWDEIALRFREQEKRRQQPLAELQAARARLEQELLSLQKQQAETTDEQSKIEKLKKDTENAQLELVAAEARIARKAALEARLQAARQDQAEARAENPRLKAEMEELKERINQLLAVEGAVCPLCGQMLTQAERVDLVDKLEAQGSEMGDRYRANQALLKETDELVKDLDEQMRSLSKAETERLAHTETITRLKAQAEAIEQRVAAWESQGAGRLAEIVQILEQESYSPEARQRLEQIEAELKVIGYDVTAHDAARRQETEGRKAEVAVRELERAQAALAPLDREITEMQNQLGGLEAEAEQNRVEHEKAAAALEAAQAQAPDLHQAESELLAAQEQENRARLELGAARQKVLVLKDLKIRRRALETEKEELAALVGRYKQLERAFGKDGVPALLIEQALPQIEAKANEILDRLSSGGMSVRFVTQAAYKDRRREDLRETLDLQISDGAGTRDYEMYSGGEAFRVNFAVRLALSEVLAQRAGARLQTLVVDEGFGSQDAQGRQRLIEAINLVRGDFAKILVITHIDELKDAFPNRIEIEKTDLGSMLRVV